MALWHNCSGGRTRARSAARHLAPATIGWAHEILGRWSEQRITDAVLLMPTSCTLTCGGVVSTWRVDAGTYLYNGEPPWNNGLAGTAVHNTVMLDWRNQMRRAGRFLWVDWAEASGRSFASQDTAYPDCFEGEHDGYRLYGVRHRRTVRALAESGWAIVDDLLGAVSMTCVCTGWCLIFRSMLFQSRHGRQHSHPRSLALRGPSLAELLRALAS